jgi:hypothetical protein
MRNPSQSSTPNVRRPDAYIAAAVIAVALGCSTAPPKPEPAATPPTQGAKPATHPVDGPREALASFLDAAAHKDFDTCWRSLASPLRARYTPARLGEDFSTVKGPAEDKLARARAALEKEALKVEGERAELPIAQDRALRLVHEADGWKILALE